MLPTMAARYFPKRKSNSSNLTNYIQMIFLPADRFSILEHQTRQSSYVSCNISAPSHAPATVEPRNARQTFNKVLRNRHKDIRRQQCVCYIDEWANIRKTTHFCIYVL